MFEYVACVQKNTPCIYKMHTATIAASISALAEVACTHPIDSLKTRMQTGHSLTRPVSWVYKGVGYRLCGVIPMRIVFWQTMDISRPYLSSPILAGAVAGVCQSIIDVPIECGKILKMTGGTVTFENLFNGAFFNTMRNAGFAAGVCAGREWGGGWQGAAIGAVVGSIITHPLDTLKSRSQGMVEHSKCRSLWNGVYARALLSCSTMGVGALVYDYTKRCL